MNRFTVTLISKATVERVFEIEAENEELANEQAFLQFYSGDSSYDYIVNEEEDFESVVTNNDLNV